MTLHFEGDSIGGEVLKRVRIRHFARAKEQGIKITGLTSRYGGPSETIAPSQPTSPKRSITQRPKRARPSAPG